LSSFDPISMQRAGTIGPEFLRGLLVLATVPFSNGLATAKELAVDAINPCFSHVADGTEGVIEEIRNAGLGVVVWSVNTPEEIALMAEVDVDVIITDDPGLAQDVMDQR
jgi:glycerophosphoryl diester phosphodiesterase